MIDFRIGDNRDLLAQIPDGSISMIATSPPFLALRSYLPEGHAAKHLEIGAEPDPATFIDTLLGLTAEFGRVLAPWGSLALELGDSYAGSGGAGGDYNPGGLREGQNKFDGTGYTARQDTKTRKVKRDDHVGGIANPHGKIQPGGTGWPLPKSLALIPQLYAIALAYGINPLTGAESPAGRWRVRNLIVWHRKNPAPGELADKFRPSTSYIIVATRDRARWFDLTAVRSTTSEEKRQTKFVGDKSAASHGGEGERSRFAAGTTGGSPPLDCWFDEFDGDFGHDVWTVNTQPSPIAHFAMWPPKLAERLILSMCPLEVCAQCGEPRRRIVDARYAIEGGDTERHRQGRGRVKDAGVGGRRTHRDPLPPETGWEREHTTVGWTDCGHDNYIAGTVLEPFAGAGTTLAVADLLGRDAIGIDLNPVNRDLYDARRAECSRSLFDSPMPKANQLEMQL